MLRRWCVPLAAVALSAGSVLAATAMGASASTAPAAVSHAVSSHVKPGGLISHKLIKSDTRGMHAVRGEAESSNWSGYAADSGTYTSVSAHWKEPTGKCSSSDQYAAFWVGLDGYSSSTVEQDGTMIECDGSTAEYLAWYEMYPADPVYYNVTVKPGDALSASVTYDGSNEYTLKLADSTQGWSESTNSDLSGAARSSAEVIVEAPCCTSAGDPLPLADFGTASFTDSEVDGSAIGDSSPTEIIMVGSSGDDKDTISALSDDENFSATWKSSN